MMPKELELSGTVMSVDGMSLLRIRNGLNALIDGIPMDVFILSAATTRRTTPKVLGHDGMYP
jgi:pantothenate kinase